MATESERKLIEKYLDIRPMNEWMRAAKGKPVPKQLFGELWREGEIAIMFADTGKGKSALAVQIGEAIARGRQIYPFERTVKPLKVLYLDFELTEKQLEMRYTADHDPGHGDRLKRPYIFSEKFRRIELRPYVLEESEGKHIDDAVRELIEPLVAETRAKILIIDNITYLKRTADSVREAVPLMKELQRLKKRFGLSIMVIAHTPKRDTSRPLVVNDLQGSKMIANYADNIFAIGQSRRDPAERYIKHIKPRTGELIYDETHVAVYLLRKIGGNFLGFEHTGFAAEAKLLTMRAGAMDTQLAGEIKARHGEGRTIRSIAEEMGLSKSAVHRYLQMEEEDRGAKKPDPTYGPDHFPGKEEYDNALRDPKFEGISERQDLKAKFLKAEYAVIYKARSMARIEYAKTKKAPPLEGDEQYREFKDGVRAFEESGGAVVTRAIERLVRPFGRRTRSPDRRKRSRKNRQGTRGRTRRRHRRIYPRTETSNRRLRRGVRLTG
jgi:predicted transcriptional regulator